MNLDFTLTKYRELCKSISNSNYIPMTVENFLTRNNNHDKIIILRHDVDDEPEYALEMAKIEKKFGVNSTYYFRYTKKVFNPKIIKKIEGLGHEIGYHYEVLSKAQGNYNSAFKIFESELEEFRRFCNIVTIAQHGSPLLGELSATSISGICKIIKSFLKNNKVFTNWVEADIWKNYDFKNLGIIGEAYMSINFNNIFYISDSGRSWNSACRIKDVVPNPFFNKIRVKNTDDIINIIDNHKIDNIYILIHHDQWRDNLIEWLNWYALHHVRNTVKLVLKKYFYLKSTNKLT